MKPHFLTDMCDQNTAQSTVPIFFVKATGQSTIYKTLWKANCIKMFIYRVPIHYWLQHKMGTVRLLTLEIMQ